MAGTIRSRIEMYVNYADGAKNAQAIFKSLYDSRWKRLFRQPNTQQPNQLITPNEFEGYPCNDRVAFRHDREPSLLAAQVQNARQGRHE